MNQHLVKIAFAIKKRRKRERGKKNETKRNRVDIAIFFIAIYRPSSSFDEFRAADEFLFPAVSGRGNRNRSVNIEVTFFPRKVTLKWSTIAHRARHLIHSSIEQKKLGIAFVGTKEAKKEARFILGIDRG